MEDFHGNLLGGSHHRPFRDFENIGYEDEVLTETSLSGIGSMKVFLVLSWDLREVYRNQ